MELLQFMEQHNVLEDPDLFTLLHPFQFPGIWFLLGNSCVTKTFLAFNVFLFIFSIFYGTFKQEKKQKQALQIPWTVSDVPRLTLLHPQVPFPYQLPELAGTQHTKETGFLQAKDVYNLPFLFVIAGAGGWLALGKPGKLRALSPAPCSGASPAVAERPLAGDWPGAAVLRQRHLRLFYVLLNRNQRNIFCTYFCNKLFH